MDRLHDCRIDGNKIAVAERKDGVEVHGRAQFWHRGDDNVLCAALVEQLCRKRGDRLARGAFAHADEDDALAWDEDVATLERSRAEILCRVAPPDIDLSREVRVELVDRGRE